MPSVTYINGTATRRPGTTAEVDASALGGAALTTNNLAVVGDFPELESAKPTRYGSAGALKESSPAYINRLIAKIIYNPANDGRVAGAPAAVYLVNGGTSAQASTILQDADGNAAITIKSKAWGPLGNTGIATVETGTFDRTIGLAVNGTIEEWNYDTRPLVTLGYTGTDASAATLSVKDTVVTKLQITQTRAAIAAGALSLATSSWKWDDEPIFTASGSGNHSLLVAGIRKDTGATFSTTLTFTASASPDVPLGFDVAAITALTWTPGAAETLSVTGFAFDLDLTTSAFRTVKQAVDHIDAYADQGWDVTITDPIVGSLEAINLDKIAAATDIFNPATDILTADCYLLSVALGNSALVDVTLGDMETLALSQVSVVVGPQSFAGGTFTAGDTTTIGNAYTAMRLYDIQIVSHLYDDLSSQQLLRSHCEYMASQGLGERNGWTGFDSADTKALTKARTAGLNTRHVGFAAQEIQINDHTGATIWAAPYYQALMFAAMQASTPVGTPLTWKLANVLDVRSDTSWSGDDDADEMLASGLCFLTSDSLGFKVERSITTYQTDDNAVFSEVSANESLYTSIRDLRQNLNTQIGTAGVASTPAQIKALAKARLRWQVANGMIKDFNEGALSVDDLGDTFRVNAEVAVVEPTNFIKVSANVTRIPFSG